MMSYLARFVLSFDFGTFPVQSVLKRALAATDAPPRKKYKLLNYLNQSWPEKSAQVTTTLAKVKRKHTPHQQILHHFHFPVPYH